ncbi:winged helix-turn-helix domain-containing protein [Actinoallomurus sp. NPDC052274]|uniref:winged helix-turn-helix domain-containing protein n=1 Tax=Actinoallomurus sp. NPDC052274 TaxID=3155420 RepID=UPI00341D2C4C
MPSAHPDRRKLYVRIADELREDLAAGRFPIGEPFPPIGELAERFGSAKATIERAVDVLRSEGLLESRQGSRTVVIALPDSSAATENDSAERSEEFQMIFGQLQEMRSAIGHLRARIEQLDERTKNL